MAAAADRRVTNIVYHQDKKLGQGSYGAVFECTDDYKERLALKKVPCGYYGISNGLEASIMSSYSVAVFVCVRRPKAAASRE